MFYRTNTNKYGLEVVVDTTSDSNFARTSGLNYVETSGSPRVGDYVHEGSFIGVDSADYNIIAEKIRIAEAERTTQEGITIPEPQPEGEVNPDPDPEEQVIPELEVPTIPEGSNGEVPEDPDGDLWIDDSNLEVAVEILTEELDWITELHSRVSTASVEDDNPKKIVFTPAVSTATSDVTLDEIEFVEDTKDDYLATLNKEKTRIQNAYDKAVADLAAATDSE